MQTGHISLSDALQLMNRRDRDGKPFPFDMTYRTFNSQSKTGGRLKTYPGAKYLPEAKPDAIHIDTMQNILDPVKSKRRPSHFENKTRNIELANGDVQKVRIDFIISINNQKVIY